jgi:hypothetical protein
VSNRPTAPLRRIVLAAALGLFAQTACAETYRVDLIVFLNLWGTEGEAGTPLTARDLGATLEPGDAAGLRARGIQMLPEDQFGLQDEWAKLRASARFRPLVKMAWTQNDPPESGGPAIHVQYGPEQTITVPGSMYSLSLRQIDGSVRLLLSRYLHLDADLAGGKAGGEDGGQTWRLDESRKLRRDELHHLDSAKLGILARVTLAAPR